MFWSGDNDDAIIMTAGRCVIRGDDEVITSASLIVAALFPASANGTTFTLLSLQCKVYNLDSMQTCILY